MVGQFAADVKHNAAHHLALGTRRQYNPALQSFGEFAQSLAIPLPETIFAPGESTIDDLHLILRSYAIYLRQHGESRTHDMMDRPMHMLATTIASKVSALVEAIRKFNPQLGVLLTGDKDRPTPTTYQISAMHQEDLYLRGENDRHRKLPLGIEFIGRAIQVIPSMVPTSLITAYVVTLLFEYVFGGRTYQYLVKSGHSHLPNCPSTEDENLSPSLDDLEEAASIHTIRNNDVIFGYESTTPSQYYNLTQVRQMPDYPPDWVSVFGTQKQHPGGVDFPTVVCQNSHLPGSANICLVQLLHQYVKSTPDRTAHAFVFSGIKSKLMAAIIKKTASLVGFDPHRTVLSGIRIGCASSSTAALFDMSQDMVDQLIQHHQQWKTPTGPTPYRVTQIDSGLVKTIQLYHLATTSIAYVIARFIARFQS